MPTFIGLDLAWTTKNESGICWLEGDSRENLRCTRLGAVVCPTEDLADEVATAAGPVVVAIDAPLLCTDDRWVDPEIGRRFGSYKFSAYPASAAKARGDTAGIDLGKALVTRGFSLDPQPLLEGGHPLRLGVEVYPHTIHVRLFGLNERLKYKKGRVAAKRSAMREYQEHLRWLIQRDTPAVLESSEVRIALDSVTAQSAKGKTLKRLDDTLDGLTCALAAWLIWKEPERWEMIGDLNGYIVVPRAADEPATLL